MTITAIPTMYNGLQFRSRLEARWAAMFDVCGFRYDYEPTDFSGYIPDFRIDRTYIEIKPTMVFPEEAAIKMNATVPMSSSTHAQETFIFSECPSPMENMPFARRIGWSVFEGTTEDDAEIVILVSAIFGKTNYKFLKFNPICPAFREGDLNGVVIDDGCRLDRSWREACNRTQWRGAKATV